jgi:hypothetical protein
MGLEKRYIEFRFRTEECYDQNIYPKRMTVLRQFQYAAECRHTLALCSELCDQGRASATDTLMAGLVSLAPAPTLAGIQRQIISMVHTEPPRIATPFVPGIYLRENNGCEYCLRAFTEVLFIFPGMKRARWALLSPGCLHPFPDAALMEDYGLLIDYALDPSLDTYEACISGNEIVIHQGHLNAMVGTAVHRSELSPQDLHYDGLFEDLSDWLIESGEYFFHLRVKL